MALTRQSVVDQITILEDGQLEVRTVERVFEDGEPIAESLPNRKVIVPQAGRDASGEDPRVQTAITAYHTPQVIADYEAARDS